MVSRQAFQFQQLSKWFLELFENVKNCDSYYYFCRKSEKMRQLLFLSVGSLLFSAIITLSSSKDEDESKKESVGTVIGIDLGTTYSWLIFFLSYFIWINFEFIFKNSFDRFSVKMTLIRRFPVNYFVLVLISWMNMDFTIMSVLFFLKCQRN